MLRILSVAFVLSMAVSAHAAIDVYTFETDAQREQYQALTKILRCPKCQNQDIADSNSPIASDMRREVHRLVREGKTEDEVVQFMVERFDEFVTYKPRVTVATYALWYGPWLLVAMGVGIVILLVRSRRRTASVVEAGNGDALSAEQRARLAAFIAQNQHQNPNQNPSGDPKP